MQNLLKRLWQDEQGQDLVEYALLLVLIALAAAATFKRSALRSRPCFQTQAQLSASVHDLIDGFGTRVTLPC